MAVKGCKRIIRATTFACAAHCYWLSVFPHVRAELAAWRHHARQIPDRVLREAAFDALKTKSSDLEGAVAFAVFAPPSVRGNVVRAITAFEIAFDYMDSIVELPNRDPIASGHCLNQALLVALSPGADTSTITGTTLDERTPAILKGSFEPARQRLARCPRSRRSLSRCVDL